MSLPKKPIRNETRRSKFTIWRRASELCCPFSIFSEFCFFSSTLLAPIVGEWHSFVLAVRSLQPLFSLLLSKRIENRWLSFHFTVKVYRKEEKFRPIFSRVKEDAMMVPCCYCCVRHNRVGRCRNRSSSILTIVEFIWPFPVPRLTPQSTAFILLVDGICQIHRHQHTYQSWIKRMKKRLLWERKRKKRMWDARNSALMKKEGNEIMSLNSVLIVQN